MLARSSNVQRRAGLLPQPGAVVVTRALWSWALGAVIPHAGRAPDTAVVAFRAAGAAGLTVGATDKFTIGLATIASDAPPCGWRLPLSEATDLLRFIRPTRVAHNDEHVTVLVDSTAAELHVAIADDSAVFELTDAGLSVEQLEARLRALSAQPTDWSEGLFNPALLARFAKAGRDPADRLRFAPKRLPDVPHPHEAGMALVQVGDSFTGAIAGLTREEA